MLDYASPGQLMSSSSGAGIISKGVLFFFKPVLFSLVESDFVWFVFPPQYNSSGQM